MEHLSLPSRALTDQRAQPVPGEIEVGLGCLPRSLFKGVQDVDRLGELRDVEHPMFSPGANADLRARLGASHSWVAYKNLDVTVNWGSHSPGVQPTAFGRG